MEKGHDSGVSEEEGCGGQVEIDADAREQMAMAPPFQLLETMLYLPGDGMLVKCSDLGDSWWRLFR